jgi:hypothetical protein
MGTSLATYYAKLLDMPDSEYKVEILEDGPIKKIAVKYMRSITIWEATPFIRSSSIITRMECRFPLLPIILIPS